MKLLGTIDEWLNLEPTAYLTNKNFVQKGVAFFSIKKHDKPYKCSYPVGHRPSEYDDTNNVHQTPFIYFGSSCPYMVSGFFTYSAGVVYYPSGSGSTFPLSKEMVEDPNWEKYDMEDYMKDLK